MAAMWVVASYSREGFSLCLAGSVRHVMVPGEGTFHLEPWKNIPDRFLC